MTARTDPKTSVADTLGRLLMRAADAVGVVLFLVAFAGFIAQIFYRYVLGTPLIWTEEIVMIAFIWTVFWAAAFLVPIREHVTFDVVYDLVSDPVRRAMTIFGLVVALIAFGLLIMPTLDYLDFLTRRKSPVLRIPMNWIYSCYLLFIVGFCLQIIARLLRLFGPNWRDAI